MVGDMEKVRKPCLLVSSLVRGVSMKKTIKKGKLEKLPKEKTLSHVQTMQKRLDWNAGS